MQEITVLNGGNILTFLLVLAALAGLFVLFASVVEAARKLRKPKESRQTDIEAWQRSCDDRFERDYRTLNEHGKRLDKVEGSQRAICKGVLALLEHELHDGNTNQMEEAKLALVNHIVDNN